MTQAYISQGVGKPIVVVDLLSKYGKPSTGRWCKPPQIPDRCDFCPLRDIKPATGYITDEQGWRVGYCNDHKEEAEGK